MKFRNRPFQRGLGLGATFLEDGGYGMRGHPLLDAKPKFGCMGRVAVRNQAFTSI